MGITQKLLELRNKILKTERSLNQRIDYVQANGYDDTEIRTELSNKQPKGDYALKSDIPKNISNFVNDKGYLTEHQDISSKADKSTAVTHPENTAVGADNRPVWVDKYGVVQACGKSINTISSYPSNNQNLNLVGTISQGGYNTGYSNTNNFIDTDNTLNTVTAPVGDSSTKVATTEFVNEKTKDYVTHKELNDSNIVTNSLVTDVENLKKKIEVPIGAEIVVNCTANYIPDGCLPEDGAEYTKAQFSDLWTNYLTGTNPKLLTCTYTEYQSDLTTYGQCAKFAVDTVNEKFRVPLKKDGSFTQQALSDSKLGKSYNAGLPNITGEIEITSAKSISYDAYTSGALKLGTELGSQAGYTSASTKYAQNRLGLDASLSDLIYGNSLTVQPVSQALRCFIVVANGQIKQSMMDWSAWASSLQSKGNKDGSNWDSSIKNIDGQWNLNYIELSTTKTAGTYTLDLSNYLPNDEYTYEVEFKSRVRQSSSAKSACAVYYYEPYTQDVEHSWVMAHAGREDSSVLILPIIPGFRSLKIKLSANVTDHVTEALCYRRIGTNN